MPEVARPDVSVIIPAFNAAESIEQALVTTLAAAGTVAVEIIVVDDGSADSTPEKVEQLAREHPTIRLIEIPNSGWAGAPRNAGLAAARGRYVFFQDADDGLAEAALDELVGFADAHGSEIVVARLASDRRNVHADVFEQTLVDAPLRLLARTNVVFKLFRRELLERLDLRFAETPMRLEDAQFVFAAYAGSRRTSILADRVLYDWDRFDTGIHLSGSGIDPGAYVGSVNSSLAHLESWPGDPADRERAVGDFFRRTILNRFNRAFRQRDDAQRLAWTATGAAVTAAHPPAPVALEDFHPLNRARLRALRHGSGALVDQVAARSSGSAFAFAEATAVRGLRVHIDLTPALGSRELTEVQIRLGESRLPTAIGVESQNDHVTGTSMRAISARIPLRAALGRGRRKLRVSAVDQEGRELTVRVDGARLVSVPRPWCRTRFQGLDVEGIAAPVKRRLVTLLAR